jgi:hypothetical protein
MNQKRDLLQLFNPRAILKRILVSLVIKGKIKVSTLDWYFEKFKLKGA